MLKPEKGRRDHHRKAGEEHPVRRKSNTEALRWEGLNMLRSNIGAGMVGG